MPNDLKILYTLAATPKFVNCYNDGSQGSAFDGPRIYYSYNSPARCTAYCFGQGYMYAGLMRGNCQCATHVSPLFAFVMAERNNTCQQPHDTLLV